MQTFEYRVLAAPAKPAKGKGDAGDRFAETLAETLNAEGGAGWEFVRAETLPCEERQGLTGTRTVFRTMLVFRRAGGPSEDEATREAMKLLEHKSQADPVPAPAAD